MAKKSFEKIVIICLVINALTIISVILLRKNLPPTIPLFYGLPVSEEELTSSIGLIIPPTTAIILIALNWGITKVTKDEFIKKIFTGLIICITAFAVIAVVKTFFLVGSF